VEQDRASAVQSHLDQLAGPAADLPSSDRRADRGDPHPLGPGKELSFVPLRPERVVEVRYDHLEGRRFRHTAQFNRWRPDRDPRSCTYDQLQETVNFDLAQVLATTTT
jgi:ATP-dependent DNA ligase